MEQQHEESSIDGFLGSKIGGGRGAGFLSGWREQGKVQLWLHPKAPIVNRWAHQFYRIETVEDDKGNKSTKIQFFRFNCLEKGVVLERQRFRDKRGQRELPPAVCPYCKFNEKLYLAIEDGSINWLDPVFKFESEEDEFVMYAGGLTGAFKSKDLDADDKKALKKAGVRIDEAYKQDGHASQQFIFCVIPHENPEQCVIARETKALGKKMQKAINDQIDSDGPIKGNPCRSPYAFEWRYFEEEKFDDKYDVVAKRSLEMTPEVKAAMEEEPPNIAEIIALGDPATLRGLMEKYCQLEDVDWGGIFEAAEALQEKQNVAEAKKPFVADDDDDAPPKPPKKVTPPTVASAKKDAKEKAQAQPAEASSDEEVFGCDVCDADMKASDTVCSSCKTVYKTAKGITGPFSRPCVHCGDQVEVTGNQSFKCGKCGSTHAALDDWTATVPKEAAPARKSRSAAATFSKPSRQSAREGKSEAPEGD